MEGENGSFFFCEEKIEHSNAKQYEVFSETGSFREEGFVVINNIPVTEQGKAAFEERFKNRAGLVESEPGFQAIRILRPLSDDTYAIMTVWDNEDSFKNWQTSKSYENAHKKRGTESALSKDIFPRPSFVTTFHSTLKR
ncbi:antibiotic biosynthesis monooxygenase family protein [Halalkalibacter akibai]|nr:antibiotic biosynthesis monooxygenase [Halalkalibacter akibai]